MKKAIILITAFLILTISSLALAAPLSEEENTIILREYGIDANALYEEQAGDTSGEQVLGVQSMEATSEGRLTVISGTVMDLHTGEHVGQDVMVEVYCEHENVTSLIGVERTDPFGMYSVATFNMWPFKPCAQGDDAWVIVKDYEGSDWEGERVEVQPKGFYDYAVSNAWVGVPEFSTITLSMAVIVGILGFVLVRKRE